MRPSKQPRKEPDYQSYVEFGDQYLSDSDPADYEAIVEQVLRASLNSSPETGKKVIAMILDVPRNISGLAFRGKDGRTLFITGAGEYKLYRV